MYSLDWKLEDIYPNKEEYLKEFNDVKERYLDIQKYKGKLVLSSDNIFNLYNDMEKLEEKIYKLNCYTTLKYHQNLQDSDNIKMYKDVENLIHKVYTSFSFVTPEMTKIDDEVLLKYLSENDKLKKYERIIKEIIKEKKHILTEKEEYIISKYSSVINSFDNIYTMLCDVNFKFDDIVDDKGNKLKVTHATYTNHLQNKDENIRKQAFCSMYKKYKEYIETITENYLSNVKKCTISAELRNYKSSLESALESDYSNEKVYNNLVDTVNDNLYLNHRYMKLKAKLLGKEKLHMYDVYINPIKEEKWKVKYEDACENVKKVLQVMGDEYVKTVDNALKNGWIDVFEKDNKYSGGYSMGVYGVHPYILLNYTNDIESESTLIHELGHTMHSYFSSNAQDLYNSEYTIMVAEVASTVNEMLLAEYLIQNESDKIKKAYLINSQIDRVRATLIRQTMFAEFEKIIHEKVQEGISLSSEDVSDIYYNLNKKYFGDDVISDEYIKYEWARIPHFYNSFYVYKYATGISSAIKIANNILSKKEGYVEKYLNMLSLGGSKDSLDLLKMVDVDLETKDPVQNAFDYFGKKIDELEKLLS